MYGAPTIDQLATAAQAVLDLQARRTVGYTAPRSVLSARAPWPAQEPAAPAPKPRRTCEENLALRAPYSQPRHTGTRIPRSPYAQLKALLDQLDSPRPVYARQAREALHSGDRALITATIEVVQAEIDRCRQVQVEATATYGRAA